MSNTTSISLAVAGKLTGLHKVSILRAIRKGKISAEKDEHGEWRLQPAELFRVYPPVPEQHNGNGEEQQYAAPLAAALEAEISALKQLNQMLRDQLDDTRGQRDKWEQAAQMALRQLPAPKTPTRFWWWPSGAQLNDDARRFTAASVMMSALAMASALALNVFSAPAREALFQARRPARLPGEPSPLASCCV